MMYLFMRQIFFFPKYLIEKDMRLRFDIKEYKDYHGRNKAKAINVIIDNTYDDQTGSDQHIFENRASTEGFGAEIVRKTEITKSTTTEVMEVMEKNKKLVDGYPHEIQSAISKDIKVFKEKEVKLELNEQQKEPEQTMDDGKRIITSKPLNVGAAEYVPSYYVKTKHKTMLTTIVEEEYKEITKSSSIVSIVSIIEEETKS